MSKRLGFIIIVIMLMGAVPTMAQPEVEENYWLLNFRGGVSLANLYSGDQLVQGDGRTGVAFSIGTELVLNENVSWEFGFGLKQKGSEGKFNSSAALDPSSVAPDTELDFEGTIKLGYVTIDAVVNGGMPIGYNGWLGLSGGLGVGFLVNSQAIGTLEGRDTELDLEKVIQDLDYFFVIGARYRYRYSNGIALLVDYRAEVGMTSVDASVLDSGARTLANIFTVGIGIPILTDG